MQNKIFFTLFLVIWVALVLCNVLEPQKEFSEEENRVLAKLPSFSFSELVDGTYSSKLDTYINDHFVFRNSFVKGRAVYERLLGKEEISSVYIGKEGHLLEKFTEKDIAKGEIEKKVEKINKFADSVSANTYMCIVPNACSIDAKYLPQNAVVANQEMLLENIYASSKAVAVNVYPSFVENSEKGLYYKTDHHINTNGAFVVYKSIREVLLAKEADMQDFSVTEVADTFLGTLQAKVNLPWTKPDTVTFAESKNAKVLSCNVDGKEIGSIYNREYLEKRDKYSAFLDGNHARTVIRTDVQNGRKLLLVKDSYAHILAQFLVQDYAEIHLLDLRYYNGKVSTYVEKENIEDVLFLYNLANFVQDSAILKIR